MLTTPVQPDLGTRTRGRRVSFSPLYTKVPYGEFPTYDFKREFHRDRPEESRIRG